MANLPTIVFIGIGIVIGALLSILFFVFREDKEEELKTTTNICPTCKAKQEADDKLKKELEQEWENQEKGY